MGFNQNLPTKRTRKKGIQTSFQVMQTTKKIKSSQNNSTLLSSCCCCFLQLVCFFVLALIFSPWKRWLYATYHKLVTTRWPNNPMFTQELGLCLWYRQIGNPHRATARASSWGMEEMDGELRMRKIRWFPSGFRCFQGLQKFLVKEKLRHWQGKTSEKEQKLLDFGFLKKFIFLWCRF